MATPFDDRGRVDVEGTLTLARWLIDHGSDGLVLTGTTGESPTLSDDEKELLWREVKASLPDAVVVAGSTTNATHHSVQLTERAYKCGVDGVLAVTPYYSRPSQEGLQLHFAEVLSCSELPVILYDIPVRTGRKIESETVLRLLERHDNFVGLKDAAGDVASTARLISQAPDDFMVFSGDDALTLPLLAVGATGVISVASHWCGPAMAEMVRSFAGGDHHRASAINRALLQSYVFESSESNPNPEPLKAMLQTLQLPGGECRLPLVPAGATLRSRAAEVLAALVRDCRKLGISIDESWRS
jgi:4-hydroxy-tetrahydrodipicolinate synthase